MLCEKYINYLHQALFFKKIPVDILYYENNKYNITEDVYAILSQTA